MPATEREQRLEQDITDLRARIDRRQVESLGLDRYLRSEDYRAGPPPPVTLAQLEDLLTRADATAPLFKPHETIARAYLLSWQGEEYEVTFDPACFDVYPTRVRFLSYGSPLLAGLLAAGTGSENACAAKPGQSGMTQVAPGGVRCCATGDLDVRAWYMQGEPSAPPVFVPPFGTLAERLQEPADSCDGDAALVAEAQARFAGETACLSARYASIIRKRRTAQYLAVRAKAQLILLRAAYVELALGQNPTWIDTEAYPAEFNEQAVAGLKRHGYPWGALLHLAHEPGFLPNPEHPCYQQIAGEKREALKGRFAQLKDEASRAVGTVSAAKKRMDELAAAAPPV